jgi:hypothetical protein
MNIASVVSEKNARTVFLDNRDHIATVDQKAIYELGRAEFSVSGEPRDLVWVEKDLIVVTAQLASIASVGKRAIASQSFRFIH